MTENSDFQNHAGSTPAKNRLAIMQKERLLQIIREVFEMADDKLLEENDGYKYSCMGRRNEMHDAECFLERLVREFPGDEFETDE